MKTTQEEILAEIELMIIKVEAGIKCFEKTKEEDCESYQKGLCDCESFKILFYNYHKSP